MSYEDYMNQFEEVDKEAYEKFLKDYGVDKLEQNFFMDWLDTYDFSLASGKYEKGTAERLDECIIAREYCGVGGIGYYIKKTILNNHNKIELEGKDMKLWMVKFYQLELPRIINFERRRFFHITPIYAEEEYKEFHRCIVDTEEKADLLVECFSNGLLKAEKIELVE